jgi:hypothetical protein
MYTTVLYIYGVVQKNVNLGVKNEFSFLDLVE